MLRINSRQSKHLANFMKENQITVTIILLFICHFVILIHQLRMQVVLDLDETLICAYETSSLPAVFRTQATEAGLNWFELECVSSDKVLLDFCL